MTRLRVLVVFTTGLILTAVLAYGIPKWQEFKQKQAVAEATANDLAVLTGMSKDESARIYSLSSECQHGHKLSQPEITFLMEVIEKNNAKTPQEGLSASLAYFILRDDVRNKAGQVPPDVMSLIQKHLGNSGNSSQTNLRGSLAILSVAKSADKERLVTPLLSDARPDVRQYAKEALGK